MTLVKTAVLYGGNRRRSWLAVAMFVALLASYVVNAMDRQLFSVLAPDVRKALNLSLPEVGLASTIFTLGMGLGSIPTGYLLQRLSRRIVVVVGLVIFSGATFLTAYANGFGDLLAYRFISGLGEAMQLTAILAIGTTFFVNHRAMAASSLNFTFGIGAIVGPILGATILNAFEWKMPFIVFGLAGVPALILIVTSVRPWFTEVHVAERTASREIDDAAASTLWSPRPLLLALATAFAGLSIYGYLGLYPTYLREAVGFTSRDAALAISCYGVGALFSLVGGWLGDRFDYRTLLVGSLLGAALSGGLLFTELERSLTLHMIFSFIFGLLISGMVYANLSAGIIKSVTPNKAAQGSALFVAALYIPAAFAGYLLGFLKGVFGWMLAAIAQISCCAILAALLCIASRSRRFARRRAVF